VRAGWADDEYLHPPGHPLLDDFVLWPACSPVDELTVFAGASNSDAVGVKDL